MSMTVTATETGSTKNGITLRVITLTDAATVANQNGVTQKSFISYADSIAITPGQAGSRVFVVNNEGYGSLPSVYDADTYQYDRIYDFSNGGMYRCTGRAAALTPDPPVANTYGWKDGAWLVSCIAAAEIKTAGTLTEDANAPAVANNEGGTAVTTAAFTPPAGSLLVALVVYDGNSGVCGITMSDNTAGGPLNWTNIVDTSDQDYVVFVRIFVADVPAGGGLNITTADPMPDATQGTAYSEALAAADGTSPYRYVIDSGSLPDGLVLS